MPLKVFISVTTVVSLWPWPLICWPQNLISSSLCQTAAKLQIWSNSYKRFISRAVYKTSY